MKDQIRNKDSLNKQDNLTKLNSIKKSIEFLNDYSNKNNSGDLNKKSNLIPIIEGYAYFKTETTVKNSLLIHLNESYQVEMDYNKAKIFLNNKKELYEKSIGIIKEDSNINLDFKSNINSIPIDDKKQNIYNTHTLSRIKDNCINKDSDNDNLIFDVDTLKKSINEHKFKEVSIPEMKDTNSKLFELEDGTFEIQEVEETGHIKNINLDKQVDLSKLEKLKKEIIMPISDNYEEKKKSFEEFLLKKNKKYKEDEKNKITSSLSINKEDNNENSKKNKVSNANSLEGEKQYSDNKNKDIKDIKTNKKKKKDVIDLNKETHGLKFDTSNNIHYNKAVILDTSKKQSLFNQDFEDEDDF